MSQQRFNKNKIKNKIKPSMNVRIYLLCRHNVNCSYSSSHSLSHTLLQD